MKVKGISIKNFKGILDEDLEFHKNLNVFIGSNGAGKTTLLDAIAKCLLKLIDEIIPNNRNPEFDENENINYFKKYYYLFLELESVDFITVDIPIYHGYGLNIDAETKNNYTKAKIDFFEIINDLTIIAETLQRVPILKYYSANRGFGNYSKPTTEIYSRANFESWSNFFHDDISYSRFFKWFLNKEIQELRKQRDGKDFNIKIPELQDVRRAIQKTFQILDGKNITIKSGEIKRNGSNELIPILELQEEGKNTSENFNSKSDGEKAIITLIADIAYNLSIADSFYDGFESLQGKGIVMIDEIEAHLHPNWQREIIPLLTQIFPNIQFFITTHSPQVISSVNSESIFIGENFKFSKIGIKSKGLDTNSLLTHIFNSSERPKPYIELLEKFNKIIDEGGSIEELEGIKESIADLEVEDKNADVSQLLSELDLKIEAYKFESENENN